jgi:hypothetical protein
MALVYCSECGNQISDKALACPMCANPIQAISNTENLSLSNNLSQPIQSSKIKIDNNVVWILAFAPLIGEIMEQFIIGAFDFPHNKNLWFITYFLNVLLCYYDSDKLKKSGYDTKSLGATWIIPAYLYNRAEMLKENNAYLWVWVLIFILILFI